MISNDDLIAFAFAFGVMRKILKQKMCLQMTYYLIKIQAYLYNLLLYKLSFPMKKIIYIFASLSFLFNISNEPIFAGPFGDEMARCLVTSTNKRDKAKLVKRVLKVYGEHPEVSNMVNLSEREKNVIDKDVAQIFTRLLSEDCADETKKALDYEGDKVMYTAFSVLGQVAAKGFNEHPNVANSMNKFIELIDTEKLDYLNK